MLINRIGNYNGTTYSNSNRNQNFKAHVVSNEFLNSGINEARRLADTLEISNMERCKKFIDNLTKIKKDQKTKKVELNECSMNSSDGSKKLARTFVDVDGIKILNIYEERTENNTSGELCMETVENYAKSLNTTPIPSPLNELEQDLLATIKKLRCLKEAYAEELGMKLNSILSEIN